MKTRWDATRPDARGEWLGASAAFTLIGMFAAATRHDELALAFGSMALVSWSILAILHYVVYR